MLSQIETGKAYPSVRSMYAIAAALNMPIDHFFPEQGYIRAFIPPETVEPVVGLMTASEMRDAQLNSANDLGVMEPVFFTSLSAEVVHAYTRPTIELNRGVTWSRLTASAEPNAEFLEIIYEPGASSGAAMSRHMGREFGLVLEGELVVELGFEVHTLRAHDSLIFSLTIPHRLSNKSGRQMRAVWVVLNRS